MVFFSQLDQENRVDIDEELELLCSKSPTLSLEVHVDDEFERALSQLQDKCIPVASSLLRGQENRIVPARGKYAFTPDVIGAPDWPCPSHRLVQCIPHILAAVFQFCA